MSATGSSSTWPRVAPLRGLLPGWPGRDRRGERTCRTPTRTVFDTMVPDAIQIADPFHVVRLANERLDECRRRVQNQTLGHRGRTTDLLYRARLLTKVDERLHDKGRTELLGLLEAGDPDGDGRTTGTPRNSSGPSTITPAPAWLSSSSPAWEPTSKNPA